MSRTWIGALALALGLPVSAPGQVGTRIVNDAARRELGILIGPVDLPAGGEEHAAHSMVYPPVETVSVPIDAYVYAFRYDVVDTDGKRVPSQVVHHLNLIDPDHRELFLPISQRIGAVGGETGSQSLPWLLFGLPLKAGQRIVVSAMLHNPTDQDYRGATVRFFWKYVKAGRPWPFFTLHPFQLDVAFPAGDKSFDLPPGKASKAYEGKPSVPGRILGVGGHLHEYATSLRFEDVTGGRLIWEGKPFTDENGNVNRLAVGRLYRKLGVRIDTAHVYRVTVTYQNPTADTLKAGGMGVVAGVFLPDADWPATDTADPLYVLDRKHYLREVNGRLDQILAQDSGAVAGSPRTAEPDPHAHHR